MKTILLFGSTGFIGGAISAHFRKKKNVQLLAPTRKECDLLRYQSVLSYMKSVEPDYIINAAYIEVNSNVKPTKKYLKDNLKISKNILTTCADKKMIKRLVFFGSGLEYGDSEVPIDETHEAHPKNYYAKTKAIQSDLVISLARQFHLPLVLLKPFNLYGPFDTKSFIAYIVTSILHKKEFSVTKGEQVRDILYIEDFIEFVEKVLDKNSKFKDGEIINAGYGKGLLLKDVVGTIIKQLQYDGSYFTRSYRDNEYFCQVADIQKAKQLVGWQPTTSLDEGIKKTIAWNKSIAV